MKNLFLAVAIFFTGFTALAADSPNDNYLFNRILDKLTTGVPMAGGTQPGAANQANGQQALTTSAAQVVAARATRRSVLIVNLSTTITVYVGNTGVTSSTGIPVLPGAGVTIPSTTAQFAVAASSTPSVAYLEVYD